MGRGFIGECPVSDKGPKFEIHEGELAIKYIKESCGPPPRGVDVEITSEGSEVGNEGDESVIPLFLSFGTTSLRNILTSISGSALKLLRNSISLMKSTKRAKRICTCFVKPTMNLRNHSTQIDTVPELVSEPAGAPKCRAEDCPFWRPQWG
jgi:hypothetical protein